MRRRTGAQKNYILGHFSATICCYYQNAGIYLRGKEYIKDENNRQHCLVYLRRISCGADVADERSHMLRHGRGHTARQAVLQVRASVCGSVRHRPEGGGAPSFIANILWIILLGWENAVYCAAMGVVCCCTIIGIPLGLQYFKFAKLAFMPFGSEVVDC